MNRILLAALLAAAPAQVLAQAPAAPATAPAYPQGQLSDVVQPQDYRLDLTVDPNKERFSGKVEIDALLKQPSATIYLHGRDFVMRRAVARVGGRTYAGTWKQLDPTGVASLTFDQPLPAGPVILAFDYDAPFQDGPAGMFRVKVGEDWYSWTQHQSIDARASFPGFDQPSFKTSFTVTLRTPPGIKAISNAPATGTTSENGMDVHRFARTLPLPTYLVAMMTGPFVAFEPCSATSRCRCASSRPGRTPASSTSRCRARKRSSLCSKTISPTPSPIPSSTRSPRRSCPGRWRTPAPTSTATT
jgi:aminopeptidase N